MSANVAGASDAPTKPDVARTEAGCSLEPAIVQRKETKLVGMGLPDVTDGRYQACLMYNFCLRAHEVRNRVDPKTFCAAIYAEGGKGHVYCGCVEVSRFEDTPNGMVTRTVPAGTYAVFSVKGGIGAIPPAYQYIFEQWLPRSGYEMDPRGVELEIYGESFTPEKGAELQIATPIVKKPTTDD